MKQIIKINDNALLSKRVIRCKDIFKLMPESIKKDVSEVCILVDQGLPRWFIFLYGRNTGAYQYIPHSGEILYDPYAKMVRYGRIYFFRKGRYLRKEASNGDEIHKTYSIYVCRLHHMILWREVKEYWMTDEAGLAGYCRACKWFRRYK